VSQTFPHEPQFELSSRRSMQAPPSTHWVRPALQTHWALLGSQLAPAGQPPQESTAASNWLKPLTLNERVPLDGPVNRFAFSMRAVVPLASSTWTNRRVGSATTDGL
jgi:hypothetical protein